METMSLRRVGSWLVIALALYCVFLAYLYFHQDSLIFFSRKTTDERWKEVIEDLSADYVTIRADDGTVLEGMFLSNKIEEAKPTVIFFGGNGMLAEEIAYDLSPLRNIGINALIMDYRGYGLSEGKPSTEALKKDAELLFDAAASHPHVDANNIIAWGYSLGTGIATHLASVRPVTKIILFAPFTSTTDLAREMYPLVPVSLLLKHKLDNEEMAKMLTQPALIAHGTDDEQVSAQHAEKVAQAWGGPVDLLRVKSNGHNELLARPEVWAALSVFLGDESSG